MMATTLSLILGAYFLGSISSAYLITLWKKGIDIREVGSGNAGARNVGRVLGPNYLIAVACFDMVKGIVPVMIAHHLNVSPTVLILTAMAVVSGHNWPIFLRFRGGNGLATAGGILLYLIPDAAVYTLIISLIIGTIVSRLTTFTRWIFFYNTTAIAGYIIMPVLAWQLNYPAEYIVMPLFLGALLVIPQIYFLKRLKADSGSQQIPDL